MGSEARLGTECVLERFEKNARPGGKLKGDERGTCSFVRGLTWSVGEHSRRRKPTTSPDNRYRCSVFWYPGQYFSCSSFIAYSRAHPEQSTQTAFHTNTTTNHIMRFTAAVVVAFALHRYPSRSHSRRCYVFLGRSSQAHGEGRIQAPTQVRRQGARVRAHLQGCCILHDWDIHWADVSVYLIA